MGSKAPAARSGSTDSVAFDAPTQFISFTDHIITDTGYGNDPMLQARIKIPSMNLLGQISPTEYLFEAGDSLFRVFDDDHEYFAGLLPQLIYDEIINEFVGEISDVSFGSPNSDWVRNSEMLFDPLSSDFDPRAKTFFSYKPDEDWLVSTDGLGTNSSVAGSDGIHVTYAVPESSTWNLFTAFLLWMLVLQVRRLTASRVISQAYST